MSHWDFRLWVRLSIGIACALLLTDVLFLRLVVAPLAAPSAALRAAAASMPSQSAMAQALLIPTYDPSIARSAAKARPTTTPVPAPTTSASAQPATEAHASPAALVARAAPQTPEAPRNQLAPLATGSAVSDPAATDASAAGTDAVPAADTIDGVTTLLVTLPTPEVVGEGDLPAETPTAAETPDDTVTPTPGSGASATRPTPAGTAATAANPTTATAVLPPPSIQPGDMAGFKAYVRSHYSTVAGQPLDVAAVSFVTAAAGVPGVMVEVSGDGANNVFARQSAAAAQDYGRRLLSDAKFFFGGQSFAVSVVSKYEAPALDACTRSPGWCFVQGYNQSKKAWLVAWTYVMATSVGGSDSVQVWNQGGRGL